VKRSDPELVCSTLCNNEDGINYHEGRCFFSMMLINKLDEDKQKATLEIRDSRTMLRTLVFLDFDIKSHREFASFKKLFFI
jgi:hypothetical protein